MHISPCPGEQYRNQEAALGMGVKNYINETHENLWVLHIKLSNISLEKLDMEETRFHQRQERKRRAGFINWRTFANITWYFQNMLCPASLLRFSKQVIFNNSNYILCANCLLEHIAFIVSFTAIQKCRSYYSHFIVEEMPCYSTRAETSICLSKGYSKLSLLENQKYK